MKHRSLFLLLILLFIGITGFNINNAIVPKAEILSIGLPKDGIPALLNPSFVKPDQALFLHKKDRVIGITINGVSKAYPIKILNWHEAVNDTLANEPIVVTL